MWNVFLFDSSFFELFMLLLQAPLSSENETVYHVLNDILELINARVNPSLVPDRCGDKSLCGRA